MQSQRIDSIDVFRGLMLVMMMFYHLLVLPFNSIFYLSKYSYGALGFFTDAEGFFFLSGLLVGILYGRLNEGEVKTRIFKRLKLLYCYQMGLFLAVTLSIWLFKGYVANFEILHEWIDVWRGKEGIHFFLDHPFKALALGSCFLYLPPFLDILPMYILFLGLGYFVLKYLKQGHLVLILGISVALWGFAQVVPSRIVEQFLKSYGPIKMGWFDPFGWQLLFVGGIVLGFLKIQGKLPSISRWVTILSVSLVILFFWIRHQGFDLKGAAHLYTLGPLRVLNFGALALLMYALSSWWTFKPLALLGKYSLQVFAYHTALCYFLVFYLLEIAALSLSVQLALMGCCICSLWIPASLQKKWNRRKKLKLSIS